MSWPCTVFSPQLFYIPLPGPSFMGRIKTQLIKKVAFSVVQLYGDKLTKNYDENKAFIYPKLTGSSKKLKNAISGYATRLVKLKKIE